MPIVTNVGKTDLALTDAPPGTFAKATAPGVVTFDEVDDSDVAGLPDALAAKAALAADNTFTGLNTLSTTNLAYGAGIHFAYPTPGAAWRLGQAAQVYNGVEDRTISFRFNGDLADPSKHNVTLILESDYKPYPDEDIHYAEWNYDYNSADGANARRFFSGIINLETHSCGWVIAGAEFIITDDILAEHRLKVDSTGTTLSGPIRLPNLDNVNVTGTSALYLSNDTLTPAGDPRLCLKQNGVARVFPQLDGQNTFTDRQVIDMTGEPSRAGLQIKLDPAATQPAIQAGSNLAAPVFEVATTGEVVAKGSFYLRDNSGSINLGLSDDTRLARSSAGCLQVRGTAVNAGSLIVGSAPSQGVGLQVIASDPGHIVQWITLHASQTAQALQIRKSSVTLSEFDKDGVLIGPVRPKVYTIATLPSASTTGANTMLSVSDPATDKGPFVYSDGSVWRYVSDTTPV